MFVQKSGKQPVCTLSNRIFNFHVKWKIRCIKKIKFYAFLPFGEIGCSYGYEHEDFATVFRNLCPSPFEERKR